MNYLGIATLVRDAAACPPRDARAHARLVKLASELQLAPEVVADLVSLWSHDCWCDPRRLIADVADALIWDTVRLTSE